MSCDSCKFWNRISAADLHFPNVVYKRGRCTCEKSSYFEMMTNGIGTCNKFTFR